eukprot:gene5513-6070_t
MSTTNRLPIIKGRLKRPIKAEDLEWKTVLQDNVTEAEAAEAIAPTDTELKIALDNMIPAEMINQRYRIDLEGRSWTKNVKKEGIYVSIIKQLPL